MPKPLAYFITWTTYGTWLPGDTRWWVDKQGSAATPYREPDQERVLLARRLMKREPVRLASGERRIVKQVIRRACQIKDWAVHALNVRSNHVHIVVTAHEESPERVMSSLKAWASRRLNESSGEERRRRWWTRHGSTRYLNAQRSLVRAIQYVRNQ